MSQAQFANLAAVNVKTLQSWQQGARKPNKPTMTGSHHLHDPL